VSELWMVWDREDGLAYIGDYDEAVVEYERCKENTRSFCACDGFNEDERTILAKVSKDFRSFDTKEPHEDANDPESNYYKVTYWDFKEEDYDEVR
jgi:hypothetical protein